MAHYNIFNINFCHWIQPGLHVAQHRPLSGSAGIGLGQAANGHNTARQSILGGQFSCLTHLLFFSSSTYDISNKLNSTIVHLVSVKKGLTVPGGHPQPGVHTSIQAIGGPPTSSHVTGQGLHLWKVCPWIGHRLPNKSKVVLFYGKQLLGMNLLEHSFIGTHLFKCSSTT